MRKSLCMLIFCTPFLFATAQGDFQTSIRINNYIITMSKTANGSDMILMSADCWNEITRGTEYNSAKLLFQHRYNFRLGDDSAGNYGVAELSEGTGRGGFSTCNKKFYDLSVNKTRNNSIRIVVTGEMQGLENISENIKMLFRRKAEVLPDMIPALGNQLMLIACTRY